MFSVWISWGDWQGWTLCKEVFQELRRSWVIGNDLGTYANPPSRCFFPPYSLLLLVHECHGALGLAAKDPREKLQCEAHMDGHKDIWGVDHHGDGGEEDGVEDGLFPGLQDIDASDEEVLVVQPGQVIRKALEAHLASWTEGKWRWSVVRFRSWDRDSVNDGCGEDTDTGTEEAVREEDRGLEERDYVKLREEKLHTYEHTEDTEEVLQGKKYYTTSPAFKMLKY